LAAVLGLIVLAALHVSHARGVRRLSEWAGGAPEGSAPHSAKPGRSRRRRRPVGARSAAILAAVLTAGGGAAFGVDRLVGDEGGHRPGAAPVDAPRTSLRRAVTVMPRTVTVAVLNGTTVDGLAAALRDRISAAGFTGGPIDVFTDQQRATSVVEYLPGHQAEARSVGRTIGVRDLARASVTSRALAPGATVIVIAGADQAP
jgi:hypothetical protein